MILPAVMVVLSLLLAASANRSLNVVLAVLYTLINISNLIGESWTYYLVFGAAEIAATRAYLLDCVEVADRGKA